MKPFTYFIIILLLFSCESKKPKNFIPKETMINLIVDMKIASKTRNYKNLKLQKNVNYMSFVYEKYKIDSTQFKENNAYYISHLDQYQEIYKEVSKRINDSLNKYQKIIKRKDSLKRVKIRKNRPVLKKMKNSAKIKTKNKLKSISNSKLKK